MAKSIMVTDKHHCFYADKNCGGRIEEHHIFGGGGRKNLSTKYGLTVYLCHNHHNEPPYGIHFNKDRRLALQAVAQKTAMHVYGWTDEQFRKLFRKSYINDADYDTDESRGAD